MITTNALRTKWRGKDRWLGDETPRGAGKLIARIVPDAVLLYFQYFDKGKKKLLALGEYEESGVRGLSLTQARDRAGMFSKLYRSGTTDLHDHLEREREADERARRREKEVARQAEDLTKRGTLRQLFIDCYVVGYLERQKKQSTRDARSILTKHFLDADPNLAVRRAADLTPDDFVALLGKLIEADKGRTASKARSYGSAAYELAIGSKTNPEAPLVLRTFGITMNPFASIGAMSRYNRPRERVLSAVELGKFLQRVQALPERSQRDALQLTLLLGGQRPAQLLRVRATDIDIAAGTITLYDPKGARAQARRHVLPLVEEAVVVLERRLKQIAGDGPVFSSDKKTTMRIETLSALVADIAKDMVNVGEAREAFQLRDLRRTCETRLAALGVSSDVRAQLQSHGLGGVQQRHYDRYDYALEKKQALQRWARYIAALIDGRSAEIVPLPTREARNIADEAPVVTQGT
jgi:integrase